MEPGNDSSAAMGPFLTEPAQGPLPIDWQAHEEEWEQYLVEALAEISGITGHSASSHWPTAEAPLHYVEFTPKGSSLHSRLWLVLTDEGVHALVATDEPPTNADVEPWAVAMNEATSRLGSDWPEFSWIAAIGPSGPFRTEEELAEPVRVGSLQIESAAVRCFEAAVGTLPSLYGYSVIWTYPVVVRGTARGFNGRSAERQALEELQLLCGLISLNRGAPWGVKEAPQVDRDQLHVPIHRPPLQRRDGEEITDYYSHKRVTLPPWLDLAWENLLESEESRNILAIYYEGILVKDRHPSLALVAYVAAIEAIGASYVPMTRCGCGETQVGATRRFRTALEQVMAPAAARHLSQSYTSRSQTVHSGRLHGAEGTGPAFARAGFFSRDPGWEFQYTELRTIEDACRKLIEGRLRDQLPPPAADSA